MKRTHSVLIAVGVAMLVVPIGFSAAQQSAGKPEGPANRILARQFAIERGEEPQVGILAQRIKPLPGVSGGVMSVLHEAFGGPAGDAVDVFSALSTANDDSPATVPPSSTSKGCPNVFKGHGGDNGPPDNIRVNQDCTLRRQAEEWVGVNPRDFKNVLAGQNDSRVGFNHCGYDWSLDGGRKWGDTGTSPPPFYQELFVETLDTADACSDPAGTFDHLGNAYATGVFFDVADFESAIWVAKSNAPFKGRFYHEPRQIAFQEYRTQVMGEPANDNNPDIFHDKELMQADSRPKQFEEGQRLRHVDAVRGDGDAGRRSRPDRLQPVHGWRRDVVPAGHHQRFERRVLHRLQRDARRSERLRPGPGLASERRSGRHDLRHLRQRQHALARHQPGSDGQVPAEPGLQRLVRLAGAVPRR